MKAENLVLSNQVHDNHVRVITRADCGKGITRESDIVGIDALVCAEIGVPFVVVLRRLCPGIFPRPVRRVAALATLGLALHGEKHLRRGAGGYCGGSLAAAWATFCARSGRRSGQCCFEVDGDVAEQFPARFTEQRGAKYHVDLWGVIHAQLRDARAG